MAESAPRPDPASACLNEAQALVDAALERAAAGDWERVADLDARCRVVMRRMMQHVADEDPGPLAEGLLRLRDAHHRLRLLAEAQRDSLVEARRRSALGRQGTRAYEDNA
ncbi:flagellar protein FliT [Thioalkalivibrio sp.]|uniref:flagellar protein FliT n=1 Tax=Thioalkalivibrio sp. TaxID=2093813 RepID=UPI003976929C